MKRAPLLAITLCLSLAAAAQRSGCPIADAPLPSGPPGPPPTWIPPAMFPEKFGDPVPPQQSRELTAQELGAEEMQRLQESLAKQRANDWVTDVEEGHVSGLLRMESRVRPEPTPPEAAQVAADVARTPLAAWRLVGYVDTHVKSRAWRMFRSGDGALFSLEEWNYKADGGAIFQMPGTTNRKVGAHAASLRGMRAPSGCVLSTLTWYDDRKEYRLEIVGPLDIEAQRALLMQVGEAIAGR
jgi:hypothetical protein